MTFLYRVIKPEDLLLPRVERREGIFQEFLYFLNLDYLKRSQLIIFTFFCLFLSSYSLVYLNSHKNWVDIL